MAPPPHCPHPADSYTREVRLPTPTRPADRYRTRKAPRWVPAVLLVAVLAAGLVTAVVAFVNLGSPAIQGKQTGYRVVDDGTVEITFQVVRKQPERAAVCIVRARSEDGDETGRKEVFVPPGPASTLAHTVLRTSRRPVTGEVFGCSYDVPPYLDPSAEHSDPSTTK